MLNINGNGVDPLLNGLVSPTQQLIMPTQSTSPHMPGVHGGGQASAGGRDSCASKRSDASHQSHDQCSLSDGGGDGGNDENGSVGSDMEELNTKELAQRISAELKRYSIPQAIFAQRVLCRSQGTLSDLLRNPKPWSKLKSGRETFRRMFKWLQEPEFQRMSALRMAGEWREKGWIDVHGVCNAPHVRGVRVRRVIRPWPCGAHTHARKKTLAYTAYKLCAVKRGSVRDLHIQLTCSRRVARLLCMIEGPDVSSAD
jgi:hypothetical protein